MLLKSESNMSNILENQRLDAMREEERKRSEFLNAKPYERTNRRTTSSSFLFWSWSSEKVDYTYDDTPVKNAQTSYETAKRISEMLGDNVDKVNVRKKVLNEHKKIHY